MKEYKIVILSIILLCSCNIKKDKGTANASTIDSTLQVEVDPILRKSLSELDATRGQIIVMEVQTGTIKASAGTEIKPQESGLVRTASLLAALETKTIELSDTIDVGNGVFAIDEDTLFDHNWRKGGYGKMTLQQGFGASSNIVICQSAIKTFKDASTFAKVLSKYGYQVKDTSLVCNPSGYGILTTPLQNLTFYNAIAQGTISDKETVNNIKHALEYSVTNGLGQLAISDMVNIAGATGTIQQPNGEYTTEFCGYFPAEAPQYSVIVTINMKEGTINSGAMAGEIFRQIAEILTMGESPDVEGLTFWTADTILRANRPLVTLMDSLYRYVYADSLCSLTFEKDLKWMNEYRNQLCRYYDKYQLGTDTLSPYAKADVVIEASRKLWELDSDGSTMGMNVKNGIEYTRLAFQQFNEYAQLSDLCKTSSQKVLLRNEITAWLALKDLLSNIYSDYTYLKYWGGSITGPILSKGENEILESHISLNRKERMILNDKYDSGDNKGVYIECAQYLLFNCSRLALKKYCSADENDESYQQLIDDAQLKLSMLPLILNKWIASYEAWANEMDTYYYFKNVSDKIVGNTLIELSKLISSI